MPDPFKKEGGDYTMDGLTGNTLNSHRLIAYAGRQGCDVQDRVVEILFKAYFTEASPSSPSLVHCSLGWRFV